MKGEYFIYHHTYQISYSTNDFVEVDANSVGVHKKISLLLIKKMEKEKERGKTSNRDFRDDIGEFNGNGEDVKCMGTRVVNAFSLSLGMVNWITPLTLPTSPSGHVHGSFEPSTPNFFPVHLSLTTSLRRALP